MRLKVYEKYFFLLERLDCFSLLEHRLHFFSPSCFAVVACFCCFSVKLFWVFGIRDFFVFFFCLWIFWHFVQ